ncbi:LPS assembly lipoprotein LptE [Gallaecimonas xiamenensis]|uniref:LPS-assembly lipoprotein LptE n=1 Tax=Gallaecimonas xiamenensis 3-C-1 TaxID=745411 RepID=K2JAS0_9GAMM|nr:LPS assembly lipoprotein LptE [Gallaecimonas xiamenensis]EKE67619.1 Rare lipoprotein B [Gallaecimonas xiamenensis 3-C-1]
MRWLLLSLTLLASGCGFHLKGSYEMPQAYKQVNLTSFDHYARITKLVSQSLTVSGVALGQGPEVHIVSDRLDRQTLSLFSTGQVAEYELVYTLNWQLILPEQEPEQHVIEVRRDYQDDPARTLAKDRERDLLLEEMRKEAADRLVRQLAQG